MSEPLQFWGAAAVTVLFGALAGGITNQIAIWMLFHPYHPPRLFGRELRWLQGAVPKNQSRLAGTIGRTVGTRLLTAEDVAAELQNEELRTAFETQLGSFVERVLQEEKPSLDELLPPAAVDELRRLLRTILDDVERRAVLTLASDEFAEDATRVLASLAETLSGERIADSLGDEAMLRLRRRAEEWLTNLVESDALAATIREHLERAAAEVLRPARSFHELIPDGLVAALEHAIQDYLPLVMERLGRLLEDPAARARVERAIHDLLGRFMQDLRFHQRVVAKLIITEATVDRVVDTLEAEGAERLGELLREGDVQDAIARSVNEAIVEFLRRPVTRVLGMPGDPQVESAIDSISDWALRAVRDDEIRAFLLDRVEDAIRRGADRSWGDVVELVPAGRSGRWAASALRAEAARPLVRRFKEWLVERILTQPIGRPGRFGARDASDRLAAVLTPPAWDWISERIPEAAARVRIADRVEAKILSFPLTELERLVRSVTERELRLIVRLGYVLGGGIGLLLVGVQALLP